MRQKPRSLTPAHIRRYALYLREQERAPATIQKYVHDLTALLEWLEGRSVTKTALIAWKEALTTAYAPATMNTMLPAPAEPSSTPPPPKSMMSRIGRKEGPALPVFR